MGYIEEYNEYVECQEDYCEKNLKKKFVTIMDKEEPPEIYNLKTEILPSSPDLDYNDEMMF